jgi:dolichyl-phosphate beta-glucosyltransferase
MQSSRPIILVIPCYNEENRLPLAEFETFFRQSRDTKILFVNDGSKDGTQHVLDELAASYPHACATLHLTTNVGKAEAVRQGFQQAFLAIPQSVGYWDADLATPFAELELLHTALWRNSDLLMVMGSRVRMLGRVVDRKALRHYLGRVIATAVAHTLDASTYDTQCGAKLFRVTDRVRRVFSRPFLTRWLFDVEILARFARDSRLGGLPGLEEIVYELPLHQWCDVPGSKVHPMDFFRALYQLIRIRSVYHKSAPKLDELDELALLKQTVSRPINKAA